MTEDDKDETSANADPVPATPDHVSEGGDIGRRKPGRPPRTTAGVDNTDTNYQPSVERNNLDQALQPTPRGIAGGSWKDFDEDNLAETSVEWKPIKADPKLSTLVSKEHDSPPPIEASSDAKEKMFPVRMLRNYRPATDRWYPILNDGRVGRTPVSGDGETSIKVAAGYKVLLPISEAKQVIKRGIGERADDIE